MTIAIDCDDCGREVVFLIEGAVENPREACNCGAVFELQCKKVVP